MISPNPEEPLSTPEDNTLPHDSDSILQRVQMLEAVLNVSTDHIAVYNREGRYLYVNRAGAAIVGLTPEDVIGRMPHDLGIPEEFLALFARQREEVFVTGKPVHGAVRYPTVRGVRDFEYSYMPMPTGGESIETVFGVARDITERLEESKQSTRILESITDAFFAVDRTWRFTYLNAQAETLLQRRREELLGQDLWEMFPEAVHSRFYTEYHRAIAEQVTVVFEAFYATLDIWLAVRAYPSQEGLSVYFQDVTERRLVHKTIAESEQRYRFMAEAMPQIVWTATPSGARDYSNQRWEEYCGIPFLPSEPSGWSRTMHPDDLQSSVDEWQEALEEGKEYKIEHRLRRKDGVYRWFLTRAVPLHDTEGIVTKWVGTSTDIHDSKTIAERQRLLVQLGQQIRALTTPEEIIGQAVQAIGKHLKVTRCLLMEVDTATGLMRIHQDYCQDVPSLAGKYAQNLLITTTLPAAEFGHQLVIRDTLTDPRTSAHYLEVYAHHQIRAFVSVPIHKEGQLVATLNLLSNSPRNWMPESITLLESVAERTWLAVENARLFQAERERSKQLATAIREVHHRVKNSLQSVASLLEIQIDPERDVVPVEALQDGLSQIKTIALVYDLLARDKPIGNVNVAQVLTRLAALASLSMRLSDYPLAIEVQAETLWMPTKSATALGLVVNELLTNAAKHNPFQEMQRKGKTPDMLVRMHRQEEYIVVTVEDNGPGFPVHFDPIRDGHIGLQLVLTLVRHDLRGVVNFANRPERGDGSGPQGARVEIVFPFQSPLG